MTLAPAVLTVDERIEDRSLVLVKLNSIEIGQCEPKKGQSEQNDKQSWQDSAIQETKVTETLFPL